MQTSIATIASKVASALDGNSTRKVGRRLEPQFLAFFIGLCAYYFYLQWPSFDLKGNYRGADPAEKFRRAAEALGRNATLEYYRTDRQANWHQEYYRAMAGGDFFQYGHCAAGERMYRADPRSENARERCETHFLPPPVRPAQPTSGGRAWACSSRAGSVIASSGSTSWSGTRPSPPANSWPSPAFTASCPTALT